MPIKNAVIAANRFGLGARPGDLARIADDPHAWLLDQLQGPSRPQTEFASLPPSDEVLVEVQALRRSQRQARRDDDDDNDVKQYGRAVRRHYVNQVAARYSAATRSEQ
ncbi:MAG: DUF1800 domain-containing protein, partial [Gammaproteobacteria bacterium]|nr:DUF1800 domain-containing protein [Gammaproteobacteria bacterium]